MSVEKARLLAKPLSYLLLNLYWRATLRKRRYRSSTPVHNVTVLGVIGLGDWCPNLSLLHSLKQVFPQCKLCVVTDDLGADFLSRQECADVVLSLPHFRRFKAIRRALWVRMNRRQLRGDLLVCPLWHRTHQLIACMLQHRAYYGYFRTTTPFMHRVAHHAIPFESNVPAFRQAQAMRRRPAQEDLVGAQFGNLRELIGGLGLEPRVFDFQVGEADRKWARSQLGRREQGERVIVLHLGCRWAGKGWPAARWVETVQLLRQHFPLKICLVGAADDAAVCNEVEAALRAAQIRTLNLCAKTTVTQLAAVVQSVDLFLGTDSGPTHLASIMGTAAVALYGPTDPEAYRPVRFRGMAVSESVECSPCGDNRCAFDGEEQHRCMKAIPANRVYQAARAVLTQLPRP